MPVAASNAIVAFDPNQIHTFEANFKARAAQMLQVCQAIEVHDQESLESASAVFAACKTNAAAAKQYYEADRDAKYKVYKEVLAKIKVFSDGYGACASALEPKIIAHTDALKAQHEQITGEVAASSEQLKAELEDEISMLRQKGQLREARELRVQLETAIEQVPMQAPVIQNASLATVEKMEGEVTDVMALIKAIASGAVALNHQYVHGKTNESRPLLTVDSAVLNYLVRAKGKDLNIPGVTVKDAVQLRRKS